MIYAALSNFILAAVFGLYLALRHFRWLHLPAGAAVAHGVFGAIGFVFVVLLVILRDPVAFERHVSVVLIVTVLLGSVNVTFHLRSVRHRTSLIVLHALSAVAAVLLTVYTAGMTLGASWQAQHRAAARQASAAAAPAPAPPTDVEIAQRAWAAIAGPVPFEPAGTQLDAFASLDAIAATLRAHPAIRRVQVQGFTDERGRDAENISLSRSRAQVVADALMARGVGRDRLSVVGYGSLCPAAEACRRYPRPDDCLTPAYRRADRRVEFAVLQWGEVRAQGPLVCDAAQHLVPAQDRWIRTFPPL